MNKVKLTIYLKPETKGILDFESQKYNLRFQQLIDEKLTKSYMNEEIRESELKKEIENLKYIINSLKKSQIEKDSIIIKMLEFIWVGLHIENIPSISSNNSLKEFKDNINKDLYND